ncbi:MAG: histidine kinase dimerization/phospho-acceptor domain-containing protein, partial [Leeuwenhoekiella sp.]
MLSKIKSDYFNKSSQIVLINKDNEILDSDQRLFNLKIGSYLHDFHPFFHTILSAFDSEESIHYFPNIKFEKNDKELYIDINFTRENDNRAYIILNDYTKNYKNLHDSYQISNESVLQYRVAEENNGILKEQRDFKNKFLSTVSHEIRTPLNAIKGFLDILTLTELDQEQLDLVNIIQNSSNNLVALIDDLLDISRMEAGKLKMESKRFDFKAMMTALKENYALKCGSKGLVFKLNQTKGIPQYLVGDSLRINQILTNLLENALKYTTRGSISLGVELIKQTSSSVAVIFTVADTGYG